MKILVYNENEKSRLVVGQLLKELSFSVILADSEEKLFEELKTESIDLVILDVNSFDNFADVISDVLKYKKDSYVLLSIQNDDRYSKTEALLKGIDDYIYNDFRLEELSAKIKAIVRVLTKKLNNENCNKTAISLVECSRVEHFADFYYHQPCRHWYLVA